MIISVMSDTIKQHLIGTFLERDQKENLSLHNVKEFVLNKLSNNMLSDDNKIRKYILSSVTKTIDRQLKNITFDIEDDNNILKIESIVVNYTSVRENIIKLDQTLTNIEESSTIEDIYNYLTIEELNFLGY